MNTRRLITHALWAVALTLPASLATGQARPAPVPRPNPAPAPNPNPGPRPAPNDPGQQQRGPEFLQLNMDDAVVGVLNSEDYTTPDGQHWDIYHVQLEAGQFYDFSAIGQGYSASVQVLTAEGDPIETGTHTRENNASIMVEEAGLYSVVIGTHDEGSSGPYILHAEQGRETQRPPRPAEYGSVDIPQGTEPFRGELNDQSQTSAQGRYYDYSVVELEAGTTYCLYVESPGDAVFVDCQNIDGHPVEIIAIEMEGAYLRFTPTVSGQHALATIAKAPNQSASYTGYAWAPQTGSSQTIVDQLTAESTLLDDGTYFDFHEVELVAGTTYVIDVTSDEFDAIAYLFDADYNQLATNDDGEGTGTNAQITFTPKATGTYSVGIAAKRPGATGGYMARVASGDRIGQDTGVRVTRGGNDNRDEVDTDNTADAIVGRWEAVSAEANGQTNEFPAGALTMVFNADGTGQVLQQGSPPQDGIYRLEGNRLTTMEPDGSDPDTSTIQIDGDTLVIVGEAEGGVRVTITLRRAAGEDPEPATDPALHGRWEFTTVTANGQTNEFPAGSMVMEFQPNGRFSMIQDGRVIGQGTYTADGNNLRLTADGETATEHNTYRLNGDEMTFNTVIPPNTPAVATLRKIDE